MRRFAAGAGLAALMLVGARSEAQVSVFVEKGPAVGAVAPDFTLASATADTVSGLGSFTLFKTRGQVVVLAFFPKVFMSGSDAQFARFREQRAELFGDEVLVAGISVDPPDELGRYAAFLGLPYPLLSDVEQKVGKRYGLVSRPGEPTRRAVYVIGRDGQVRYRDFRFDATNDASFSRLGAAVQAARR